MIRNPHRWWLIAKYLAEHGQESTKSINDHVGGTLQATSNMCGAMERYGYLQQIGIIRKRQRRMGDDRKIHYSGPYRIYAVTAKGRALEEPPPADPRKLSERPVARDRTVTPFGAGQCELANALGLVRR